MSKSIGGGLLAQRQLLNVSSSILERYWVTRGPVDSRVVGRISEATHITDIKRGSVGVGLPMTYAARLKLVLGTLGGTRTFRARSHRYFKSPLSRLRTLHYFRWVLIDRDTRLMFTSEFDNSWEKYIRQFVDSAPNLVDLIWTHTQDYDWGLCSDYERFAQWVRNHQQETSAFFVANPNSTVKDIQQQERLKQHLDAFLADLGTPEINEDPAHALAELRAKIQRLHDRRHRIGDELQAEFFPGPDVWQPDRVREYQQIELAFGGLLPYFTQAERGMFDAARREFMGAEWAAYKATLGRRTTSGEADAPRPAEVIPTGPELSSCLREVQGNILSPYRGLDHAQLLFFRVDSADVGASFLERLAGQLTTSEAAASDSAVNVAISFSGFKSLGFPDSVLQRLPDEFRIGMSGRAAQLGDGGLSLPDYWQPPLVDGSSFERLPLEAVDVAVFVHARTTDLLASVVAGVEEDARTRGVALLGREETSRQLDDSGNEVEPFFGFRDGVSQPRIAGIDHTTDGEPASVKLGEIVLGHEADRIPRSVLPRLDELGLQDIYTNGSFLAMRRFDRASHSLEPGDASELARRFGRHADGSPLVKTNGSNGFDYGADVAGKTCPFGSHARRANPRFISGSPEGRVPRIMRRALPTLPRDAASSGLVFMAFNASLAQQYEVLQSWLNNANIVGGFSSDADPIASTTGNDSSFTHFDMHAAELRTQRVSPPLRVSWGLYLFEPSRSALRDIRKHIASANSKSLPDARQALVVRPGLRHAHGREADTSDAQTLERCLSESPTKASAAQVVWDGVDAVGGVARSSYGVLVSSRELIHEVFERDGLDFSVMEYGRRMENALGRRLYLGEDYGSRRPSGLARASSVFQAPETIAYVRYRTREIMTGLIARAKQEALESGEIPSLPMLQVLPAVLPVVVAEIYGFDWSATDATRALGIAVDLASFIFNPHVAALGCPVRDGRSEAEPGVTVEQAQKRNGDAIKALCSRRSESPTTVTTVIEKMAEHASAESLASLVLGTMAPTAGTYSSLVKLLVGEGNLARLRSRILSMRDGEPVIDRTRLDEELLRAMQVNPMPGLVYRRCLHDTALGGARIEKDELVMLRISATPEEHRPGSVGFVYGQGVHQCPGIDISIALLSEIFGTLLERVNARPRPSKAEVAFDC
jgi:deferrochelatase/peroxidase EfeB